MSIPNEIVAGLKLALHRKVPGMTELNCYQSIAPAYIEGQEPIVVQIIPGAVSPAGGGTGYQDGGSLVRTILFTLVIWQRVLLDPHGHSEIVLLKASDGMLGLCEKIRETLAMTVLGGLLAEPMKYAGESATSWYDMDMGVVRRDVMLEATFALNLPTTATV